jgi:hypothetical protein
MLSEAPERDEAYKNYPIVLDDPAARKYVAAAPYHGYDFKDYSDIAKLHERLQSVVRIELLERNPQPQACGATAVNSFLREC